MPVEKPTPHIHESMANTAELFQSILKNYGLEELNPTTLLFDRTGHVYLAASMVAKLMDVTPQQIGFLARQGRLTAVKPGHDLFVLVDSALDYIQHGHRKPGPKRKSGT